MPTADVVLGYSDLADIRDFRLDRFAVAPHEGRAAFSHSYLR